MFRELHPDNKKHLAVRVFGLGSVFRDLLRFV